MRKHGPNILGFNFSIIGFGAGKKLIDGSAK